MSTRKRNEFLDDDESDDDVQSQHSEDVDRSRSVLAGRGAKRRKVTFENSDLSDEEETAIAVDEDDGVDEVEEEEVDAVSELPAEALTPKDIAKAEKAARKSGVVYISRVPPFMKPHTLKHFLSQHASKGIGRIFLTPEDHNAYLSRKKNGGNKKKSFTDGWVEFMSKTEARAAAETLNGNIIGGKKRGYYHDDIWNMKYLSGFKWSHLTEQIATENAEREARMRDEIRRTRQENREFLQDFEKGKMLETMERKRAAKDEKKSKDQPAREFKQSQARRSGERDVAGKADVQRALSMIF